MSVGEVLAQAICEDVIPACDRRISAKDGDAGWISAAWVKFVCETALEGRRVDFVDIPARRRAIFPGRQR